MFGIFLIVVGIGAVIIGLILFIALCVGGDKEDKDPDVEFEKIIDEEDEDKKTLKELGIDEEENFYPEESLYIEKIENRDSVENICNDTQNKEKSENTQNLNDVGSVENKEDVNKNSGIEAQDGFDRDKKLDPEAEIEFERILKEHGIDGEK